MKMLSKKKAEMLSEDVSDALKRDDSKSRPHAEVPYPRSSFLPTARTLGSSLRLAGMIARAG
jgi:hypothetical protein